MEQPDGDIVQKLRFDVFTDNRPDLDQFLEECEYSWCVRPGCDQRWEKLKEMTRGINVKVKKGTFVDCQRRTKEEVKEWYKKKRDWKA